MAASKGKDNYNGLLMVVIGIVIVLVVWYFVFNPLMDDRDAYNKEIEVFDQTISDRTAKVANQAKIEEETEGFKKTRDKVMKFFPADIKAEDDLLFCKEVENATKFFFTTTGVFGSPIIFFADSGSSLVGYNRVNVYEFAASYASFKEMVDFINYYPYRRSIKAMKLSYDSGILSGELALNEYYVVGGDNEYKKPAVTGQLGNDNPFNTLTTDLNREDHNIEIIR